MFLYDHWAGLEAEQDEKSLGRTELVPALKNDGNYTQMQPATPKASGTGQLKETSFIILCWGVLGRGGDPNDSLLENG